ncbi:carbohydrate esterase family 5 protein [Serendipita vermifera MAFF 305830]|uniref:Carbohydrate esterase family 5 protein n=1 Tax=Serendipita vermifera MAFF 305830 TaxID=933852 RepID=A0A0C3B678_SERVB|nr:carbohydrate esterase family 5 protein [Serendipita vermifera MAFF 305830]
MFIQRLLAVFALTTSVLGAPVAELDARQACSAFKLVHVAGTTEIGLGVVGTPLSVALASAVPGATTKSITYDTTAEYIVTVAAGAAITASYIASQAAACPSQRFILSGYSKGALVLHSTTLSSSLKSKVAAILVFGDPARNINQPWPINSPSVDLSPRDGSSSSQNIASFCNFGDVFCWPLGVNLLAHLAYPTDGSIGVAANFVKNKV